MSDATAAGDGTSTRGDDGGDGAGRDDGSRAERRRRAVEVMSGVYGWTIDDHGPGDEFFDLTLEHLFGEIWARPGLTNRDRRLLLVGYLVGRGLHDVIDLQLDAALGNGELSPDELREITIFLTHYAGWPSGAKLNNQVMAATAKRTKTEPT